MSYAQSVTPQDHAVADLIQFLKFASVSTDPAHKQDTSECADWLVMKLTGLGLAAETARNARPPGRRRAQRRTGRAVPTVMIYGHYDVQPADPLDLWKTPPFEPRIEDGVIYARGSDRQQGANSRPHPRRPAGAGRGSRSCPST